MWQLDLLIFEKQSYQSIWISHSSIFSKTFFGKVSVIQNTTGLFVETND